MSPPAARVTLVGLRCSGKTTVGRALAEALAWPFVDLDAALALRGGRPVGELLAALGPLTFRDAEAQALAVHLAAPPPLVLATGGGAVLRAANRRRLAATRCFWLEAPAEVLVERLLRDGAHLRPSLTGRDPADEMEEVLRRRAPLFDAVAEARLDARRPVRDLVDELVTRLGAAPPARPVEGTP